jgi:PAS domain S-box-containing protein
MKRLFQSLSSTNDGAFIIDKDHRIIFWNQAAEKILEYTAGEVAGRLCFEILGGRDEQGITLCQRYCWIAIQAERGDILPNTDVYAHTRNGEGRWLNVTTFVYPVSDKTMDRVIVHLFRDATEKKDHQRFVDRVLAASEQLEKDDTVRIISVAPTAPQTNGLTAREREVLTLLAQGQGTEEIAGTLIVSPATVRNHAQNILNKLGVHSRLEAVAYAYQNGLIETKIS